MTHQVTAPYLLFLGDVPFANLAKTAYGLRDWAPDRCLGQVRLPGCAADLGLPDLTPAEAAARGARSLVIGVAPMGGVLPAHWLATLFEAVEAGLDLAAGLHERLRDVPGLADRAASLGRALHDVRHHSGKIPMATGKKRRGRRALTVGLDCALGKKYAALAVARALQAKGIDAEFRATGQTGILISGEGIAIDAVVADFVAGAAELLSPEAPSDHWDIIEGQGSLFHPFYAGVTLGLIHGSQPDAMFLCGHATRTHIELAPDFPHVSYERAIEDYERMARLTNPASRVTAISVNTSGLAEDAEARAHCHSIAARTGLPCTDPIRFGAEPLATSLFAEAGNAPC
jgi:uncharacterized NAD-dependent epimerase/dehydratase family protein